MSTTSPDPTVTVESEPSMKIEIGPEFVRLKVGPIVMFYSLDKHCAGWFNSTVLQCPDDCVIHRLPRYHVVRLWDYDRERS